MPNRPRGKNVGWDGKNTRKKPNSNRTRFNGAETADGKFQSRFDLYLMEKQGCSLEKAFPSA